MERVNLLQETEEVLEECGYTWDDVLFVSAMGYCFTDISQVKRMMDFEYRQEHGDHFGAEVDHSLLIVGKSWYLERNMFDYAEWWEICSIPCMSDQDGSKYPYANFRSDY